MASVLRYIAAVGAYVDASISLDPTLAWAQMSDVSRSKLGEVIPFPPDSVSLQSFLTVGSLDDSVSMKYIRSVIFLLLPVL